MTARHTGAPRAAARRRERGVALPLVLAVLVCLIAVAIPFSLSMRHEQGGVNWRTSDDAARRTALAVRDLALARLGESAPDRDPTPWSDPPDELALDLEQAALALGIDDLGPRGRLLSAELEDQSGRIDLNAANLLLVARLLGMQTTLAGKLTPEDRQVRLADGDFLQERGFLWIDGEITRYERREGSTVHDLLRPAVVPGIWEPALMAFEPREHAAGEVVIDFRAWMVAAWLFKAAPGFEARFDTLLQPFAVERFGHGVLQPAQRARLERFAAVLPLDGDRARFGNPQRVLSEIVGGQTRELRIEQGHFAGRGMIAKVTPYGGDPEYAFVLRSSHRDDGAALLLEMPLLLSAQPGQAQVEFLLPRPVNVNSASRETLLLLLEGLKMRGASRGVDRAAAERVADRIIAARPLTGMASLFAILDLMVEREKSLDGEQRVAILVNAEHSGCYDLDYATAPFCWASDGVVEVRAAASLNYELNGRERARAFLRELVATAGAGRSVRVLQTQRDFEEPWRISRRAREWTTFPENLNVFTGGVGSALPQSRLPAMAQPRSRFPSEESHEAGARLATAWYDLQGPPIDRTWHMDGRRDDVDSKDPEGWRVADGVLAFDPGGGGGGLSIALSQNLSGTERPKPFGVSLWWNPGDDLGSEQVLFDWKCNGAALNPDLSDRVRLRLVGGRLEFEVNDAFLRASDQDLYTSKIVYDFTDGLLLEGDTWYHVTAFCRGNRAGQMSLWVDGKPRGKWSHYARLAGSFTASSTGSSRLSLDVARLAEGTAKFPPRGAVRLGSEVVEYSAVSGGTLTVARDDDDRFGGLRPAPSTQQSQAASSGAGVSGANHPSSEGVELYGYSARLASDVPAGNVTLGADGLPEWGVAKVSSSMAKVAVTMSVQQPGGGGGGPPQPIELGRGFDADVTTIDVVKLDGGQLADDGPLLKGGGYAALVSYYFGRITARDDQNNQTGDLDTYQSTTSSWIQGIEVIHYGSCSGGQLRNVRRGQALASELSKTDFAEFNTTAAPGTSTIYRFLERHAFVVRPSKEVFAGYAPTDFTVLVVPLSVVVTGSPNRTLLVPESVANDDDLPEMAQIESTTTEGAFDPTEWIRYDAIVQDQNGAWNLLRADPKRIHTAAEAAYGWNRPAGRSDAWDPSNNTNDFLFAVASNPAGFGESDAAYEDLLEALNDESLLGGNPDGNTGSGSPHALAFRGVLDTGWKDKRHDAGAEVFPVFRTARTGPRPGRHDEVTIVGSANERPERHFINYAWCQDSAEDHPGACHVALLTASGVRYVETPGLGISGTSAANVAANITWYAESRNFARLLKFPSGELPSRWDGSSTLTIGGAAGATGGGRAKVDEVRLFAAEDPQPILAHGLHQLTRDLSATESNRFEINDDALRFPHDGAGQIGATPQLHTDACVWQIGDEYLLCGERQMGRPVVQEIAPDGRLRFSGADDFFAAGFHAAGETAQVLPWLAMTRLNSGLSASDSRIELHDAGGFPRRGCVLIDQEVIAYTDLDGSGGAPALYVPTFLADPDGRTSGGDGEAAFRGRYGSPAMTHAADAIVMFWPYRYPDGYAERADLPELAALELPFAARRALWHAFTWSERQGDPLVRLVAQARVRGRGGFAADPALDPDFFVFDRPGTREQPNRIDRQGDLLLLRFLVDYREGAWDPVDFTGNAWKRAPLLELVAVEYLADRVVERHEETR